MLPVSIFLFISLLINWINCWVELIAFSSPDLSAHSRRARVMATETTWPSFSNRQIKYRRRQYGDLFFTLTFRYHQYPDWTRNGTHDKSIFGIDTIPIADYGGMISKFMVDTCEINEITLGDKMNELRASHIALLFNKQLEDLTLQRLNLTSLEIDMNPIETLRFDNIERIDRLELKQNKKKRWSKNRLANIDFNSTLDFAAISSIVIDNFHFNCSNPNVVEFIKEMSDKITSNDCEAHCTCPIRTTASTVITSTTTKASTFNATSTTSTSKASKEIMSFTETTPILVTKRNMNRDTDRKEPIVAKNDVLLRQRQEKSEAAPSFDKLNVAFLFLAAYLSI